MSASNLPLNLLLSVNKFSDRRGASKSDKMDGYDWSKLPQEIKDLIYKEVLLARGYIIVDPEPWARLSLADPYSDPTPAYAGMMLASKETSTAMQEI